MLRYVGFLLAFCVQYSQACDICGCSSFSGTIGLLPNSTPHFIGLRSSFSSFHSEIHEEGLSGTDYFWSQEIWGRYTIKNKWVFSVGLPFHSVRRVESGQNSNYHQLGDLSLTFGRMFQWKNSSNLSSFLVNFGTKLPTGEYQLVKEGRTLPPGLQPGSGSFDFIGMVAYNRFSNKWGTGFESSVKYSNSNDDHYRQGHRLTLSGKVYYKPTDRLNQLWCSLGFDIESTTPDQKFGDQVVNTGGNIFMFHLGLNLLSGQSWNLSANTQIPFYQNLNNNMTHAKSRFSIQFFYFL
ncbi:MAG: transporter [Saprospiraceae bacterium]|nr:transporter [Saprospiraceae bacterium]MBK7812430.1 transporter [Saprospiraceae bacterium]MBK9632345.1 transporter [Saprospiraceae bacterium]